MFQKILVILYAGLWALCAQQPPSAALKGVVRDPSGAVIPDLKVKVRSLERGNIVTAVTDRSGIYAATGLTAGTYSVLVKAQGFSSFEREGIELTGGQTTSLDITLVIGSGRQSVTITSKAPTLEGERETDTKNQQETLEIREVRESSARDVGEALENMEGLWKIRKGGIANDIVLRGFQQDNLNVLIDGVRVFGACPNNMDPPSLHVDFSEVQQVNVLKGPFDIKNQGSLGGVVDIISRTPGRGLEVTPTFATGSFGYLNPSLVASFSNRRFFALAGYSLRRSRPYVDGSGHRFTDLSNYSSAGRGQNGFDVNTSWFRWGLSSRENQHTEVAYTAQRGNLTLYPYLMMDSPYDHADRLSASHNVSDLTGVLKQLKVQAYFTQVKHWMTDEYRLSAAGAPRSYSMATFAGTKSLGGRVEAGLADFVVGFESYLRNWNAVNTMRMAGTAMYNDQPIIPNVNVSHAGVYSQYQKTLRRKLLLTAGARLDTSRSQARSGTLNTDLYWAYQNTRSLSRRDTHPSGNVWAVYTMGNGFELFGGAGHTVRVPDPQERYFAFKRMGNDYVGDPNLNPTRNTELDFGVNYRHRRFTLRPTVFYSRLDDYIAVQNQLKVNATPYVVNQASRSYANMDARIRGGELGYSVSLSRALLIAGGLSYCRGTKQVSPGDNILSGNLAEFPPFKSRASLRYGNRFMFLEFENVAAWAQNNVDTDLKEQGTPGYAVMNFKLGVHTKRFKFAGGIDNLSNRFYYEHLSYQRDPFRLGIKVPEPGRSLYLTANYAF